MRPRVATHLPLLLLVALPFGAALARGGVQLGAVVSLELLVVALVAATVSLCPPKELPPSPLLGAIGLLWIWAAFSWSWSVYPGSTRLELAWFTAVLAFFLLAWVHLQTRRTVRHLVWMLLGGGSLFAVASLLVAGGGLLGLPTFARRGGASTSLTFVNYNHFAGFMAPLALLGLGLALELRGAARALALSLSLACHLAVVVSLSRGGILGLLCGLVFLLVAVRSSGSRNRAATVASLLGVLTAAIFIAGQGPVRERLATLSNPLAASPNRIALWASSWGILRDRPWLGSGLGTFRFRYPFFQGGDMKPALHAHNDFFEIAVELGVVGLAFFVAVVIVGLRHLLSSLGAARGRPLQSIGYGAASACVYSLVHALTDFNYRIPSNALLYAACLAIAFRAAGPSLPSSEQERSRARVSGTSLTVLLALSGVLFVWVGAPWVAAKRHHHGEVLLQAGDPGGAIQVFRSGLRLAPDRADTAAALGDAHLLAGDDQAALGSYDQAVAGCSSCLDIFLARAQALELIARTTEAEAAFRRAAAVAPNHRSPFLQLGLFLLRQGRAGEAIPPLRHSLLLAGDDPVHYERVFRELERFEGVGALQEVLPLGLEPRIRLAHYLEQRQALAFSAQQWEEVMSGSPEPPHALGHLRVLARGEDPALAARVAADYASRFREHQDIVLLSASILDANELTDQARSLLHELLRKDPGNLEATVLLGLALCRGEQTREGIDLLEAGLEKNPMETRYLTGLAHCHLRTGRVESALIEAKRAVELAPSDTEALHTLGVVYQAIGLFQQAAEAWTRCLEIYPAHLSCRVRLARLELRLQR